MVATNLQSKSSVHEWPRGYSICQDVYHYILVQQVYNCLFYAHMGLEMFNDHVSIDLVPWMLEKNNCFIVFLVFVLGLFGTEYDMGFLIFDFMESFWFIKNIYQIQ